jgi:hypothetical protein
MRTQQIKFIFGDNVYRARMINTGPGWRCLTLEASVKECRQQYGSDNNVSVDHDVSSHWRCVDVQRPGARTRVMLRALVDHLNAADTISIVESVDATVKEAV